MGKKADQIREHYNSFETTLYKILITEADSHGTPVVLLAERRMQELRVAQHKLQNTPQESKAGAFAIAVVAENAKVLAPLNLEWATSYPDYQARAIERLVCSRREAETQVKALQEALDRQQRSWEPVSQALGQQGHESALDAAKRVVAERDEARAHAYAAEQDAKEAEARCAALIAERDEARAALKAAQESLLVYVEDAQKRAKQSEGE